jgi:hypothetical protein
MYDTFILMIFWQGDPSHDLPNEIAQLVGTELLFKVDVSVRFNSRYETSYRYRVMKLSNDPNILLKFKKVETLEVS